MRALALAALLGAGAPSHASSLAPAPGDFAGHLAELINDYRLRHGLGPLAITDDLENLASEHSVSMAERRQLSHDGFLTRFHRASSKVCVENVGWNFRTPEGLFEGWRESPEHHRNLLEPKVERMGIAVDERYVTFFACR